MTIYVDEKHATALSMGIARDLQYDVSVIPSKAHSLTKPQSLAVEIHDITPAQEAQVKAYRLGFERARIQYGKGE